MLKSLDFKNKKMSENPKKAPSKKTPEKSKQKTSPQKTNKEINNLRQGVKETAIQKAAIEKRKQLQAAAELKKKLGDDFDFSKNSDSKELQKELEQMLSMPIGKLRTYAYRKVSTRLKPNSQEVENPQELDKIDFTPMMRRFLKPTNQFNQFEVNLFGAKGRNDIEASIGLAHILSENITEVEVTDLRGNVRRGQRKVHRGRAGYFDENNKYINIFSGYKVKVASANDKQDQEFKSQRLAEFVLIKELENYQAQENQISIDEVFKPQEKEKPEDKEQREQISHNWRHLSIMLAKYQIKIADDTINYGGGRLREMGNSISTMILNRRVQQFFSLIKTGGNFENIQIEKDENYQFNLSDLEAIFDFVMDKERALSLVSGSKQVRNRIMQKHGKNSIGVKDIIRLRQEILGGKSVEQASIHPRFRDKMTPAQTLEEYSYLPPLSIDQNLVKANFNRLSNGGIYVPSLGRKVRLGEKLPSLWCARSVSLMLGLRPMEASSGALFSRLARGRNAQIVTDYQQMKPGDIVFYSGTYGNTYHRISHVGIVVEQNGKQFVLQQSGLNFKLTEIQNSYWQRKFYAAVRQS
jgi:hypothetical protein